MDLVRRLFCIPAEVAPVQRKLERIVRNERMPGFRLSVRRTACGAPIKQCSVVVHPDLAVFVYLHVKGRNPCVVKICGEMEDVGVAARAVVHFVQNARICPECNRLSADHSRAAKARFC